MSSRGKKLFNPHFGLPKGGWSSEAMTGWVNVRAALSLCITANALAVWTHPGYATLVDPPMFVVKKKS